MVIPAISAVDGSPRPSASRIFVTSVELTPDPPYFVSAPAVDSPASCTSWSGACGKDPVRSYSAAVAARDALTSSSRPRSARNSRFPVAAGLVSPPTGTGREEAVTMGVSSRLGGCPDTVGERRWAG